jgi:hypothetical protein
MKVYKSYNEQGEQLDIHETLTDAKKSVAASESRGCVYAFDISVNAKNMFALLKSNDVMFDMMTLVWEAE